MKIILMRTSLVVAIVSLFSSQMPADTNGVEGQWANKDKKPVLEVLRSALVCIKKNDVQCLNSYISDRESWTGNSIVGCGKTNGGMSEMSRSMLIDCIIAGDIWTKKLEECLYAGSNKNDDYTWQGTNERVFIVTPLGCSFVRREEKWVIDQLITADANGE